MLAGSTSITSNPLFGSRQGFINIICRCLLGLNIRRYFICHLAADQPPNFHLAVRARCLLSYENMLISHTHRFLFVHVPKTAGSSVTAALQPFCDQPEKVWFNRMLSSVGLNVNWLGPVAWRRGRKHTTAEQMQRMYPVELFQEYLAYEIKRDKISQTRFLTDANGELLVDYVGCFESLAEHFNVIRSELNIDAELEHRNSSSHRDYQSYYDATTRQMVAEHWRQDIERFGYSFEGDE
jgi:hypothetical protein